MLPAKKYVGVTLTMEMERSDQVLSIYTQVSGMEGVIAL